MTLGNEKAYNTKETCDLFAKYFSSIYVKSNSDDDHPQIPTSPELPEMENFQITFKAIIKKLKRLDCTKGKGPDNIPPIFFNKCARSLAEPLSTIFNTSLTTGIFPSKWKEARIVPIFKAGNKELICNYRPISILSTLSKTFEALVYPHLYNHIKHIISHNQHGFVTKRSTNTNLIDHVSNLAEAVDNGLQIDSIYTDFAKAFDSFDHQTLLRKLKSFGITKPFFVWCESYLEARTLKVGCIGWQ
ncbi:unnamed protein product [Parnassius mnemosyne]|uniref:Reverse transcriptase domain-containing protein n=1 Tax=Parnassius mnemosyne TaxID=213953 RepID=A0AAV1MCX5_9NEOP